MEGGESRVREGGGGKMADAPRAKPIRLPPKRQLIIEKEGGEGSCVGRFFSARGVATRRLQRRRKRLRLSEKRKKKERKRSRSPTLKTGARSRKEKKQQRGGGGAPVFLLGGERS